MARPALLSFVGPMLAPCLKRSYFALCRNAPGLVWLALTPVAFSADFTDKLTPFFNKHCYECHDASSAEGGLDLDDLSRDLDDEAVMEKWVRLYDRVADGEMPPGGNVAPSGGEKRLFSEDLGPALTAAHKKQKGTVLRRLNRREYENTINDLLGIHLDLAATLPEDGRSGEFDTVGEALGISPSQMRSYL